MDGWSHQILSLDYVMLFVAGARRSETLMDTLISFYSGKFLYSQQWMQFQQQYLHDLLFTGESI